jgi:hypothetical protein
VHALVLVFVLVLVGAVPPARADDGGCAAYADRPVVTGHVPQVLPELSGLAASRRHRGIYWAHNDSGHAFTVYALRENGTVVASFPILDVTAVDPEDIGVGPCTRIDHRTCIWIADTGDNLRSRTQAQIVRVIEPDVLRSGPLIGQAFAFTYPDGAHDAEALLVDPQTAEIYVVTKSIMSLGDAYRVDCTDPRRPTRATHVAALSSTSGFDALVTAGSVHPSGTRVLLRTYRGVWEFRGNGAPGIAALLAAGAPRPVPSARQLQGEAVAYTADGTGYLLGAEGDATSLFRVGCRRP